MAALPASSARSRALYFQRTGATSPTRWRCIAAKNRKNGVGNPLRADAQRPRLRVSAVAESEKNPFGAPARSSAPIVALVSDGAAALVLADVETALTLDKAIVFRAAQHVQDFLPMSRRDILKFEGCGVAWQRALALAGGRVNLDDSVLRRGARLLHDRRTDRIRSHGSGGRRVGRSRDRGRHGQQRRRAAD